MVLSADKLKTYFVNNKRHYGVKNKLYPSVTTILAETKPIANKIQLSRWKDKVGHDEAERISKSACYRGTVVHSLIENKLLGVGDAYLPICPDAYQGFWNSLKPVLKRVSAPLFIEHSVWHPLGFAGTVDCVANFDGELSVIDWKTATNPKKEDWIQDYFVQISAYVEAVKYLNNVVINQGVIVIALEDACQVFKFNPNDHWEDFKTRLEQYQKIFGV